MSPLEQVKTVGDVVSVGIVGSTILQWMPAAAAFISIIWGIIRIYETKTVQRLLKQRRGR